MEILPLQPLSQAELDGVENRFIESLFSDPPWPVATLAVERMEVFRRIVTGGYPEVVARKSEYRQNIWFRSYINSLLQRDVRDLANIEGLTELPRLLQLLAARSSGLMNMSEVSRASGLAHTTLRRYLSLLEATFILQLLPAWSPNFGKRLVKSPKLHLIDSGLVAHLRGEIAADALQQSPSLGPLMEQFVVQEIRKLIDFSGMAISPYHFRTSTGQEVDMVLEGPGQSIVGVEIKSSAHINASAFKGLKTLAEVAGDRFHRGVLIYMGDKILPFGERMIAVPVSALWANAEQ